MTKSKLAKQCSKFFQRRNHFLYFAGLLFLVQFYIGYNFYNSTQEILAELRPEMQWKENLDNMTSSAAVVTDGNTKDAARPAKVCLQHLNSIHQQFVSSNFEGCGAGF